MSEPSTLRGTVRVVSVESLTLPDVKVHPPGLRLQSWDVGSLTGSIQGFELSFSRAFRPMSTDSSHYASFLTFDDSR